MSTHTLANSITATASLYALNHPALQDAPLVGLVPVAAFLYAAHLLAGTYVTSRRLQGRPDRFGTWALAAAALSILTVGATALPIVAAAPGVALALIHCAEQRARRVTAARAAHLAAHTSPAAAAA